MTGSIWAQVQSVRVGQPPELPWRAAGAGESVHFVELAVVHYRILDAARFGYRTEVSPQLKWNNRWLQFQFHINAKLRVEV